MYDYTNVTLCIYSFCTCVFATIFWWLPVWCRLIICLLAGFKMCEIVALLFVMGRLQYDCWYANRQRSATKITKRRTIPGWKRFEIAWKQSFRCAACWLILPKTFHIDHRRPLAHFGCDEEFNWQALCPSCHDTKSVTTDRLFATQHFSPHQPVDQTHLHHLAHR